MTSEFQLTIPPKIERKICTADVIRGKTTEERPSRGAQGFTIPLNPLLLLLLQAAAARGRAETLGRNSGNNF